MAYNERTPGGSTGSKFQLNTNHSIAILLLLALVALWALRHIYGSISVSAGTN